MHMRYFIRQIDSIDDRTYDYIEKRVGTLSKFLQKILVAEVEIERTKKGLFRVEVMIKTPRALYRAEDTTHTIEESVDLVENELKRQVVHVRDKRRTLIKRGAQSIKKKAVIDTAARFRR